MSEYTLEYLISTLYGINVLGGKIVKIMVDKFCFTSYDLFVLALGCEIYKPVVAVGSVQPFLGIIFT